MTTQADFKSLIAKAADGHSLSQEESRQAFDIMMSGEATASQIGGFLMALRVRGETVDEITGAAKAMRAKAHMLNAPEGAVDTAGTGGDSSGTYNISTAAAIVIAGAGLPVAKHGNRALSSKSGSADVLNALGVNIDADWELVQKSINEANVGFLMAPRHHGAMRHVGPTRVELGTRTIFNLLGPLSNPAGTKRQLVGIFAEKWVNPVARVFGELGATKAWVVHGSDGLDEITTTGPTIAAEWANGTVRDFVIDPEDYGIPLADPADLKGADAATNAAALRAVLEGAKNAYRDIVVINTGAALVIGDKASDLAEGIELAKQSIDSGAALARLDQMIAISHEGDTA